MRNTLGTLGLTFLAVGGLLADDPVTETIRTPENEVRVSTHEGYWKQATVVGAGARAYSETWVDVPYKTTGPDKNPTPNADVTGILEERWSSKGPEFHYHQGGIHVCLQGKALASVEAVPPVRGGGTASGTATARAQYSLVRTKDDVETVLKEGEIAVWQQLKNSDPHQIGLTWDEKELNEEIEDYSYYTFNLSYKLTVRAISSSTYAATGELRTNGMARIVNDCSSLDRARLPDPPDDGGGHGDDDTPPPPQQGGHHP